LRHFSWDNFPANTMAYDKVWQNLAIFGGIPIGGAIEVLLTKVINRRSSVSPIVVFCCPHPTAPLLA
jgi:hypothetical protein